MGQCSYWRTMLAIFTVAAGRYGACSSSGAVISLQMSGHQSGGAAATNAPQYGGRDAASATNQAAND